MRGGIAGMRRDVEAGLWVNLKKAQDRGYTFYRTVNGAVVTRGKDGRISPDLIVKATNIRTGKEWTPK